PFVIFLFLISVVIWISDSGHAHSGHGHSGHAHSGHGHSGHAHSGHGHSGHAHFVHAHILFRLSLARSVSLSLVSHALCLSFACLSRALSLFRLSLARSVSLSCDAILPCSVPGDSLLIGEESSVCSRTSLLIPPCVIMAKVYSDLPSLSFLTLLTFSLSPPRSLLI
uniref:Secreted protein n=1 Tax=Oncorhynchus tshawytscha TaxID=74940 RepID=A0AAZ3Q423_ONCTS